MSVLGVSILCCSLTRWVWSSLVEWAPQGFLVVPWAPWWLGGADRALLLECSLTGGLFDLTEQKYLS